MSSSAARGRFILPPVEDWQRVGVALGALGGGPWGGGPWPWAGGPALGVSSVDKPSPSNAVKPFRDPSLAKQQSHRLAGSGPSLGDRLWALLLVSRLFGLSPVGPAPTYRPAPGWTLYCWLVHALTVSCSCYRMVTNLLLYVTGEQVPSDLIATYSPTVLILTSVAYIANFFCNAAITLALGRKVRLLHRAVSFPVCAPARTHPSRRRLTTELFLVIFFYAGTNCVLLYYQVGVVCSC